MLHIEFTLTYLEIYIISISMFSFLLYGYDKALALKIHNNISRVSENKLLLTTVLGGTIGSLSAMLMFRHKIKKHSFIIKFLLIVVLQIVIIFLYYEKDFLIEELHTFI